MAGGTVATGVPDVVAPPPKHPRFPHSDGVRGVAALAVVIVHSWLFAGGFGDVTSGLGNRLIVRLDSMVAIFFLLSAFLLYRPMIAHRTGGPKRPSVGDFGRRRFLRIYPVFWVALTCLAIFPGVYGVFSGKWWLFYSLGQYLDPGAAASVCPPDKLYNCGFLQSWTLTVEVTFYLVLPLYAALANRMARGRPVGTWVRNELILLAALAAASLFCEVALDLRDDTWFNFSFAAHMDWLGLGLAMAVLSAAYGRREAKLPSPLRFVASRPGWCWLGAIAIYLYTVAAFPVVPFTIAPFTDAQFLGVHLTQCGVAALLLIPVFFGNPNAGLPRRILANRYLLWLGVISYSFYLWQVTIGIRLGLGGAHASFLTVLIGTMLITVPIAALSYYLIEAPLMRLKYRSLRDLLRRPRGKPKAA
jgi:peptidoglycan/LPS O-acetylase OafA/YrhL